MKRIPIFLSVLTYASAVFAAPLVPTIVEHDFAFGAYNSDGTAEYQTNGAAADTLTYMQSAFAYEVISYRPSWPDPPTYPIWDANDPAIFGGDMVMAVQFTASDAPPFTDTVSLIGSGANPSGPDLQIFGSVNVGGIDFSGLLWALELEDVSLYGLAHDDAYVLEGVGTIDGGKLAEHFGMLGAPGAMRGHLDFFDQPAGWMPAGYDPTDELCRLPIGGVRAAYSGETGVVPEPITMAGLLFGLAAVVMRRR